jgi:hypothetical protein
MFTAGLYPRQMDDPKQAHFPKPETIIGDYDRPQVIDAALKTIRGRDRLQELYLKSSQDLSRQVNESRLLAVTTGQDFFDELRAVREQVDELRRLVRRLMSRRRRPIMCRRNRRWQP